MTPVALIGAIGLIAVASPVVATVNNESADPLTVSVSLTSSSRPLIQEVVQPNGRARGAEKARTDAGFIVRCRPPKGPERIHKMGYVTTSVDQRATFTIRSCDDIDYDQVDLMLP